MPENAVLSPFIESVEIHPEFLGTLGIQGASGIFFIEKGLVGVFHEFEGKSRLSHVYDKRDIFFSNEVLPELNKQQTTWKVFGEAEVLFLNLGDDKLKAAFPQWYADIQMFISLYSTYQYQDYINGMGLDRKVYSVQWLRDHPNALAQIPRGQLAEMLNISLTSLKSFIKKAIYE